MRKTILALSILALVLLDQASKFWIVAHLELGQVIGFIPKLVSLTYLRNYGAAFSILQNQQWLFTFMTFLVLGAAFYYLLKHLQGSRWLLSALVLIISGGLCNFIDRIRLGYVVDMVHLDFVNFAIFNVADAYLTIGVLLLLIIFWKEDSNGTHN